MVSHSTDYYIDEHTPVFIDHNNEEGDWYYSVALYDCRDDEHGPFWLCAFPELQYALDYCMKHKLPVMGTSVNYWANKTIEELK